MKLRKHKTSLRHVLLLVLLFMVVLQSALPLAALFNSGTKNTLEQNEIDLDRRMVENRKVSLENEMTNQWGAISKETDGVNDALAAYLQQKETNVQTFLSDSSLQDGFIESVFPSLFEYSRNDSTCGAFIVLANDGDISQPGEYNGVFLRDSDPTAKAGSNSDMYLERGNKALARQVGIALDSSWSPQVRFEGSGRRDADDFFYEPYSAAREYPDAAASDLGYWSMPFVLEDNLVDNHRMIAYSIPLVYQGTVYGVMGIEVSCSYLLNTCFSLDDFTSQKTAGYAIAYRTGDGAYTIIDGMGVLCNEVESNGTGFTLSATNHDSLFRVDDVQVGNQGVYALTAPMNLYSAHVPYSSTQWLVCGFVSEDSIYAAGDNLYSSIVGAVILCVMVCVLLILVVSYVLVSPLKRLIASVQRGREGIDSFTSNLDEVSQLHQVIKSLTDTEFEARMRLNEEKERYRMAVEGSDDTFFTVYEELHSVEVLNSSDSRLNRTWSLAGFKDKLDEFCGAGTDWFDFIQQVVANGEGFEEYRMPLTAGGEPRWVEVSARWVPSAVPGKSRIVGYLRDINERKLQEIKEQQERMLDPATLLYRYEPGMKSLHDARQRRPEGAMVVLDLRGFSKIVQRYGFTFGDMVLEDLAKMLVERGEARGGKDFVAIRAGADEFLVWVPGQTDVEVVNALRPLRKDLASLVGLGAIDLRFRSGIAMAAADDGDEMLVRRARVALAWAKWRGLDDAFWSEEAEASVRPAAFGEIVSSGYARQVGLPSLAVNLLDRRSALGASLDLLARRLEDRFSFDNLAITAYDSNFASARLHYLHKPIEGVDKETFVTHYGVKEAIRLQRLGEADNLISLSDMPDGDGDQTRISREPAGAVFLMNDNGLYSGSIFLLGLDDGILNDVEAKSELWEVCGIIQNRINQEHVDQSARAKSDFLARMSHELRTPMNGVIGMTDIALMPGQTEERRIDCLEKVRSSSYYLLDLLNDILDMTKIESGKMRLLRESFSLNDLIVDLHSVLDGRFAERKQVFVVNASFAHVQVMGDVMRLKQILINLLGNAIKYSGDETQVTLAIEETSFEQGVVGLRFAVSDQGIGIGEKDMHRIFAKFEQLDNGNSWQHGTGLGLSICSHLARMMNSAIKVESALGKGSTFSFVLHLPVSEQRDKKASQVKAASVDFTGMNVLLAEDNELNREIIRCMLERFGCVVTSVADGKQAVEAFRAAPAGYYEMMFLDVMMPEMNGLDAARAIRAMGRADASTVTIIAVSANAFAEDVQRSLVSGMDAHIPKPIDSAKLAEVMSRFV